MPQAYCGTCGNSRAYVSYAGRLTSSKELKIQLMLAQVGYTPGWKCKNVKVKKSRGGMWEYKEDGGSGLLSSIEVFHLQGDR